MDDTPKNKPSSALSVTSAFLPEASTNAIKQTSKNEQILVQNVPLSVISGPVYGPAALPARLATKKTSVGVNHLSGTVEATHMDSFDFETQRRAFMKAEKDTRRKENAEEFPVKRKREDMGIPDSPNFKGPWAGYESDKFGELAGPTGEEIAQSAAATAIATVPQKNLIQPGEESSILHEDCGDFMKLPQLKADIEHMQANVPQRIVKSFQGHTKPITSLCYFPVSCHLFLSGSLDGRIKLWSRDVGMIRTYLGHNKGIKNLSFSADGTRFVSCSYDGWVKIWETESGKVLYRYECENTLPNVVRFCTSNDDQSILIGLGNGKIVRVNMVNGKIVQTFDDHLRAVVTIEFIDSERFISTGEDRTFKVWDLSSAKVLKSEHQAFFHVMPSVALHPEEKNFAIQSLDNSITVYSTKSYKPQRKRFYGHQLNSFHCSITFSSGSNGRILCSGDGNGALWLWDWETGRIVKKIVKSGTTKPITNVAWNKQKPSEIICGSWDGIIRMFE